MVRDTSIDVLEQITKEGMLSNMRLKIYKIICDFPNQTAGEIFHYKEMQTNQSGRFTELEQLGVIRSSGKRNCTITGRLAHTWEITGEKPNNVIFKKSNKDKLKKEIYQEIEELYNEIVKLDVSPYDTHKMWLYFPPIIRKIEQL
jgi:hypothetical protein